MERAAAPPAPWTLRVLESAPLPLAWLAISALFYGLLLAWANLFGWTKSASVSAAPWQEGVFLFELLWAVIVGYVPTAIVYALRGAACDLEALRPLLDDSDPEFAARASRLLRPDPRGLLAFGVMGAAVGLGLPLSGELYWADAAPPFGSSWLNWHLLRGAVVAILIAEGVYVSIALAQRFSELGAADVRVDLLDRSPLLPFARQGLRSVLLLMGLVTLLSLFLLAPFPRATMVATVSSLVALSVVALLLPVRGVHLRLRDAKRKELERVNAALRESRSAALAASGGAGAEGLSHWVVYHDFVQRSSTWPFDVSTVLRFALYVSVGASSWIGSAFVERALESALG